MNRRMRRSGPPVPALIVGYGNLLRGDDAAGLIAAGFLSVRSHPRLRVLQCQQLNPELAEALARVRRAVFLDADPDLSVCRIEPLSPAPGRAGFHQSDPAGLLHMSRALYGHAPRAWLIHIPAHSFELGAVPSAATLAGARRAARLAYALCLQPACVSARMEGTGR
jgi:hydrogenase maturation protease